MIKTSLLLTLLALAIPSLEAADGNPPMDHKVPNEELTPAIKKLMESYSDLSRRLHHYNKWQDKLKATLASESPDTLRLRVLLCNLFEVGCDLEASYPDTQKMWPKGCHEQLQQFIPAARKAFSLSDKDTSFRSMDDASAPMSDDTLIAKIKLLSQKLSPIDANIPMPQP